MLTTMLLVLVAGGGIAWWSERLGPRWPAGVALMTLLLAGLPVLQVALARAATPWFAREEADWLPRFGIRWLVAADGFALVLLILTLVLGVAAVVAAWHEVRFRPGLFFACLLAGLAGAAGVFVALDLFLFFVFWEVMLVPMFFLIALWGHEHRRRAALKFFVFTQGASLAMLVAMIALVLAHEAATGVLTFDYFALLEAPPAGPAAFWMMLGFFVAFAVKLPAFPFHGWLPDAHTEAPTAGSIVLAGVLLKTGAYGIARFVLPLFPEASIAFAPVAMWLGAFGVVYGAVLAFAQDDAKRLVAYSSVSHLGFALLGLYAFNTLAMQGVVMQLIAHGVSTGALFMLVGALQHRLHTRDLRRLGGLAASMPRFAALLLFFTIASLGAPGLGNFVGEFMVLAGAFRSDVVATVVATLGLVLAAAYALVLVQRAIHGPRIAARPPDLGARETTLALTLAAATVWLGMYPQPVFDAAASAARAAVGPAVVVQARQRDVSNAGIPPSFSEPRCGVAAVRCASAGEP